MSVRDWKTLQKNLRTPHEIRLSGSAEDFVWASGIEDTFVPQTRPGHRALDEYQLMGHYEHWREDLSLLKEMDLRGVRWGVPWYRVEPEPGEFDWSWTDEVIPYIVEELKITPIIDLMHYGCPFWMKREFVSRDYVPRVANYAARFAERYKSLVRWYTPLNEPLVNALMCGKRGLWPPYLRGDTGYIKVMLQLARGIVATVKALKEVDPEAIMVHVEATGLSRAIRQDLETLASEDQRRGYVAYDLITGQITPEHPLFAWLLRNGASPDTLAELAADPIELEIIGMNFYPQWSTQHLYIDRKGRLAYRAGDEEGTGFAGLIKDYYHRYRTPIIITETSAFGADDIRARWLASSVEAVKSLREQGVPVLGYTWFPLFTMIDWRYRHGTGPVSQYRVELGLFRLGDDPDSHNSHGRWRTTPLVEQLRGYVQRPRESVGDLNEAAMTEELHASIERLSNVSA